VDERRNYPSEPDQGDFVNRRLRALLVTAVVVVGSASAVGCTVDPATLPGTAEEECDQLDSVIEAELEVPTDESSEETADSLIEEAGSADC
jgi:hypothetical protein